MRNIVKLYFFKNIFYFGKFQNFLKFNSDINEDGEFPFKNYYHEYQENVKEENTNIEINTVFESQFLSIEEIDEYKKKCDIFQKLYNKYNELDYSSKDFDVDYYSEN